MFSVTFSLVFFLVRTNVYTHAHTHTYIHSHIHTHPHPRSLHRCSSSGAHNSHGENRLSCLFWRLGPPAHVPLRRVGRSTADESGEPQRGRTHRKRVREREKRKKNRDLYRTKGKGEGKAESLSAQFPSVSISSCLPSAALRLSSANAAQVCGPCVRPTRPTAKRRERKREKERNGGRLPFPPFSLLSSSPFSSLARALINAQRPPLSNVRDGACTLAALLLPIAVYCAL